MSSELSTGCYLANGRRQDTLGHQPYDTFATPILTAKCTPQVLSHYGTCCNHRRNASSVLVLVTSVVAQFSGAFGKGLIHRIVWSLAVTLPFESGS
jgi:hypothetical protein